MSHIATVGRHHSRVAQAKLISEQQQQQHQQQTHTHNTESQGYDTTDRAFDAGQQENSSSLDRSYGGLSQISVITISGDDDDDLSEEMNIRRTTRSQARYARERRAMSTGSFMWASNPIGQINSVADIGAHIDSDLEQANAICRLEDKWQALTKNFEKVLSHLQDCSKQVTHASKDFLETMYCSVDTTCDRVDEALKAQHQLMTMCDDLTTKLSIVGSFRDEIRTLRKSVETLEQLYKNKPAMSRQAIGS